MNEVKTKTTYVGKDGKEYSTFDRARFSFYEDYVRKQLCVGSEAIETLYRNRHAICEALCPRKESDR